MQPTTVSQQRDPQTFAIIGAAMEVHQVLGSGFLEAVYHESFALELQKRNLPFSSEVMLPILYKGSTLVTNYRADFVLFSDIIVEIKALETITSRERAQVLNYLKASGMRRGLLINFGSRSLQSKWLVWG